MAAGLLQVMTGVALLTVWLSEPLLLPKPVSPLYSAVIEWVAAVNVEIEQDAEFPVSATALQIVVVPSLKVTLPSPFGLLLPVTVAVNVTWSPYVVLVFGERDTVVVVT